MLREIAPTIDDRAIAEARDFFQERTADLDVVCYRKELGYWPKGPRR